MPRGHKSKLRAREKRHQARCETRSTQDAQVPTVEERVNPSSSSTLYSSDVQSFSDAESLGKPKMAQRPTTASVSAPGIKSDEGVKSQDEVRPSTSWACSSTSNPSSTKRVEKAVSLIMFMLRKHKKKEPITKEDILEHVIPHNREEFPDVLKKASELMVLTFAVDVKETDPTRHCYELFSIFSPTGEELTNCEEIMPKSGLLMTILCLIFMNGSCINEEYVWLALSVMGVYAGVDHFIYGNVKKLITKDFVDDGYLEYRRVPYKGSHCYQFLWGPRALFETSKMKVLEFLAKVHNTVPSAFPSLYEEALRANQERMHAKFASMMLFGFLDDAESNDNSNNSSNQH
ncbi:hypothetical protein ACRRTK_002510 [Alexandromys fortis]